jgi:hypothetical protein
MTLSRCKTVTLACKKDKNREKKGKIARDKGQTATLSHQKTINPKNVKSTYLSIDCHAVPLSHKKTKMPEYHIRQTTNITL